MLACEAPKQLTFPLYASPKLDGVRCIIVNGHPMSRTLKPIPNKAVQQWLSHMSLDGLDGELIVGSPTASDVYRETSSGVMSQTGEPDFVFYAFDLHTRPADNYERRLFALEKGVELLQHPKIKLLPQTLVNNEAELAAYETQVLEQGYEGVMLRNPTGGYKQGRSTAREGLLLKLKRFTDGEATITGFDELMHNGNEAQRDELGNTKRSSHQENLVPMDTLGALCVVDCVTGVAFKIGTGYTAIHRKAIWQQRETLLGAVVKYKHFEIGVKDAPRFPVWLGFRDPALDM